MSSIQANAYLGSSKCFSKRFAYEPEKTLSSHKSYLRSSRLSLITYNKKFLRLSCNTTRSNSYVPVSAYTGNSNSENADEAFSLDLKKAIDKYENERTVVGFLQKQIKAFQSIGGGGGLLPPWGRGNSGGSGDEYFKRIMDESLQVILAFIGFVVMFIFIVRGEELTRLGIDYIGYLRGARTTGRLRRAMDSWKSFCQSITGKQQDNGYGEDSTEHHRDGDNTDSDEWIS